MESIFEVAKYFLSLERMSHKKLQKLCYYAQAWSMALTGAALMSTWFEAWIHGPVSPELWHKYKEWGGLSIPSYEGKPEFKNKNTKYFLNKIYRLYGEYSGEQLEHFTHNEEPWIKARNGLPPNAICKTIISTEDMKNYYRKLLH